MSVQNCLIVNKYYTHYTVSSMYSLDTMLREGTQALALHNVLVTVLVRYRSCTSRKSFDRIHLETHLNHLSQGSLLLHCYNESQVD